MGRMASVLITGFEPFDGAAENPSALIALRFNGSCIAGHEVIGAVLPCVFRVSIRKLKQLMRQHEPALVICLGQAGGRAAITPERVAINLDDARIADNAGAQPMDRPIVRGGPAAYWSTLPIKAMVQTLRAAGVPAEISQTAGTFVCNHVFYGLMHELRRQRRVRGGFIHVPGLPSQGKPAMSLARMEEGIRLAVATAIQVRRDSKLPGGSLH